MALNSRPWRRVARFLSLVSGGITLSRNIHEIGPGDFVKVGGEYKEVKSTWGVGTGNRLAKPSEGGFGVITTDGRRVGMMEAQAYAKKEDLEPSKK
jgi:hypothetical protein